MNNRNERELKERRGSNIKVIGITGGIGSGKTVATDALKAAGYTVIDADEVSRAMFGAGTAAERELVKMFPQAQKDGGLDRKKLREIISADKEERLRLNDYTHPLIIERIKQELARYAPPIILSAPLLFESSLSQLCDVTVCIYCPRNIKIERLTGRDGITRAAAERIIDAQIPDTERATLSDYIVPSDVPLSDFRAEILDLFNAITSKQ